MTDNHRTVRKDWPDQTPLPTLSRPAPAQSGLPLEIDRSQMMLAPITDPPPPAPPARRTVDDRIQIIDYRNTNLARSTDA